MTDVALEPVELTAKYQAEIVLYSLSAMALSPFQTGADTISAAAFVAYLESDLSMTPISAMIAGAATFTNTDATAPLVGSGSDAIGTYILQATVDCPSGRRYILRGRFTVIK